MTPAFSVVIPTFERPDTLGLVLDALARQEAAPEFEVVVVDDGSSDATWERMLAARDRHPSLLCVQFSQNRGKRAAMAEGIRRSSAEICVFALAPPFASGRAIIPPAAPIGGGELYTLRKS